MSSSSDNEPIKTSNGLGHGYLLLRQFSKSGFLHTKIGGYLLDLLSNNIRLQSIDEVYKYLSTMSALGILPEHDKVQMVKIKNMTGYLQKVHAILCNAFLMDPDLQYIHPIPLTESQKEHFQAIWKTIQPVIKNQLPQFIYWKEDINDLAYRMHEYPEEKYPKYAAFQDKLLEYTKNTLTNLLLEIIITKMIRAGNIQGIHYKIASTFDDRCNGFDMVAYKSNDTHLDEVGFFDITFNIDALETKLAKMKTVIQELEKGKREIEFCQWADEVTRAISSQTILTGGVILVNKNKFNSLLPAYLNAYFVNNQSEEEREVLYTKYLGDCVSLLPLNQYAEKFVYSRVGYTKKPTKRSRRKSKNKVTSKS